MKFLQSIDEAGARWASRFGDQWQPVYHIARALGSPLVTLLILASLAAWAYHTKDHVFFQAAVAYILALGVGVALKFIIARKRPNDNQERYRHASYSFPSGHSLGSVLSLGLVAHLVWFYIDSPFWSWTVLLLCIGGMIVIGLSRLYRRGHYLTDVLGGWLLGVVTIALAMLLIFR